MLAELGFHEADLVAKRPAGEGFAGRHHVKAEGFDALEQRGVIGDIAAVLESQIVQGQRQPQLAPLTRLGQRPAQQAQAVEAVVGVGAQVRLTADAQLLCPCAHGLAGGVGQRHVRAINAGEQLLQRHALGRHLRVLLEGADFQLRLQLGHFGQRSKQGVQSQQARAVAEVGHIVDTQLHASKSNAQIRRIDGLAR